jgi:type I restriction enzyme S subunit
LLADLPDRWEIRRFKAVLDRLSERNDDLSYEMLSLRSTGDVVPRSLDPRQEPDTKSLPRYFVAHVADLIVNPMWLIGGGIGVSTLEGAVSPDYRVFRPRSVMEPRFLHYLLRSQPYLDQYVLYTRAQTTFDRRVQQGDLDNLPLAIPPIDEQQAIVLYLDRETARIDRLIEEQHRLIEMLEERRGSLIARTLLRGLDAGATLRDSGDVRLGEVPAHWQLMRTRHLCTITTGSEDSGNATDEGAYPFYVRGKQILRIGHYSFDGEAVMTPGDGQGGTGKVFHYFNGKFEAHQRVYVFKDFIGISGRYFYYFISTFLRPVALASSNTVTMESLRRPVLADFAVLLPPVDEQASILAYLDEQTSKIDRLIAETERLIELARERRSALITAAVTGQMDVREEVA